MTTLTAAQIENIKRKLRNKARLLIKNTRDWTDGKGVITRDTDSHETITHERLVEKQSRQETNLRPLPLIDIPNQYEHKKRCSVCGKWQHVDEFTGHNKPVDCKHPYCNTCRAAMRRMDLTPTEYRRYLKT